ncbi:hypothetical protein Poli38472_001266 [Pythium oligandrum]|uniref:Uncharacterized protein n=1 Tax=Pythium oligandrum TaxID=41045 RepID=A0A8K1CUV9_PYTOL|nr:hypothetical protein Poli38472_001266 [Pythium oligandrum]|eukprot:TMW69110.1 hypothetical protein Poli38472_001266 [Pythium oligandrum]
MDGPLANLQAHVLFDVDHDAAKELLQRNPRLQYLHLTKERYFCEDYQTTRHKSRAALGVDSQEHASSQAPFRPECQRAFLSVLERLDLDALENAVVRQIFAFASSNVEREVWADDTGRYISFAMMESRGPRHIRRHTAPSPEPQPEPQGSFWSRLLGW